MLRTLTLCAALVVPALASAQTPSDIVAEAVNDHILPRYGALVDATSSLAGVAQSHCQAGDPELQAAFNEAFDAWIGVSHITFGPAETDGRYFALSFWPDARGTTGRSLAGLISDEDPIVGDAEAYTTVSVAARGFFALEFLLYDPTL
ncbi:MAG: imelysin family protein, partial [Pseudomonadota bacterium]